MTPVLRCFPLPFLAVTLFLAVTGLFTPAFGQLITYDSFNAPSRLIDGNKWGGFETEFRGTEATRRLDAGKLRLTYRAVGNLAATPAGTFFADFGLFHPDPNAVTILQAQIEVVDFEALACPGNTAPSEVLVGLLGSFFNTGIPVRDTFTNDVQARIFLVRRSNAPADTVRVEGHIFRCTNALCTVFDSIQTRDLGPLACPGRVCPPVTLRITWEPAANRFRFLRVGLAEQIIAYSLSDLRLATRPFRLLSVAPIVATCTPAGGRKRAFADALFDNVVVNTPPASVDPDFDDVDLGELPVP